MDAHDPMAIVRGLASFAGRGAGTDAERRAATWLAKQCIAPEHEAEIEAFWSRPNWALAQLWHVALAVTGSLITLASPIAGIALLAIALVSIIADALAGVSLGRRLTPERASQNVVVAPSGQASTGSGAAGSTRPTLVLSANYDTGRIGLIHRLRPTSARITQVTRGAAPGWLGWLVLALLWLLGVAILREAGHTSPAIGAVQLPPTVGVLLAFALLLELATGDWSPGAGDNATGVAVALALSSALSSAPPRHLDVRVVLTGAGDTEPIGLRRYLRAHRPRRSHRPRLRPPALRRTPRSTADTIVLALAASGGGTPHWWHGDGALLPLRYSPAVRRIAEQVASDEAFLQAQPHRGRGSAGALPARFAGLPALTVGGLDESGVAPGSHQRSDTDDAVEPQAMDLIVQFALLLIDGIDGAVAADERRPATTPA